MHPSGSISYVPSGRFNFPRSYIYDIRVYVQHTVSHAYFADNIITVDYTPVPAFLATIKLRRNVYDWSSNCYTLDYLIEENWYVISAGGTEFVLPLQVGYASAVQSIRPAVNIVLDLGVDIYTQTLPSQPSSYWLPPPPSP